LEHDAQLIVPFLVALVTTLAVTPVAIAVAVRTDFHDRPVGYKGHGRPTPYLGGAAVLGGFLVAAITLGGEFSRLAPIVVCATGLWVVGTIDDRVGLPAWPRLVAESAAAIALWSTGLGWEVSGNDLADLALTIVWVVGLVNAFNLIDNMDGAAASLAAVTAAAVGALALIQEDLALAALALGLAGACAGFLPYNLAAPARIFLGDGGSLPIGFAIAAVLMVLPGEALGAHAVLAAGLLAGVPVVDTALVMVSRRRAGLSIITAGRDHLTHRLRSRLGSARTVALTLGVVQAGLGAVAIGVVQLGRGSVLAAWAVWFVVAAAAIALLETSAWAPVRESRPEPAGSPAARGARPGRPAWLVEGILIAFITVACGLSPFLYGFYDISVWGPIALLMLAGLLGLLIARPAVPRRTALAALAALAGLWLWSLLSTTWAESADQAMTEANRWLLYAALFAVVVLLLRDDRLSRVVIGAATGAIVALGLYLALRMALGGGSALFLGGRLNQPLGYVNGQAAYLLLGVWPLVALAERIERWAVAGLALAGATLLVGLVVLSQTRAVVPAVLVSAVVIVALVPGRGRRVWALLAIAAGVAVAIGPLLEVYSSTTGSTPTDAVLQTAAVALLGAAALAGAVWAGACLVWRGVAPKAPRALRRAGAVAPFALAAVAAALAVGSVQDPSARLEREYRNFVQLEGNRGGESRFVSGGGNRYDYWRIAWKQFAADPLYGIGTGNYDRTYFLERRTGEDIRQPHSIQLQVLGELGLVGGAALAVFVVAVLAGLWRRSRRSAGRDGHFLAVAAGGMFIVWLTHTSVDWLHVIPGVTGLALAAAAVLLAPWRAGAVAGRAGRRRVVTVAAAIVIVLGAVLVGRAALAERYRSQGKELLVADPRAAVERADRSLALDDEALPTYYLKAAAYARLDDYPSARAVLLEATRREPHDFLSWALLGDLAVRRGDIRLARRYYGRAHRLNPRDLPLGRLARDPRSAASTP
jgi:UDP-GlcNAc:undecaprenyl-phosphate GlcNAc-1-phosphate transferase